MSFLSFLLCPALAFSQAVMGPARFTVIAPELIRLEYQKDGRFIDDPSLFAWDRGVRYEGFTEERSKSRLIIDTGRIRLIYVPDGRPFHPGNIRALINSPDSVSEWKPGLWSKRDLGGARNLDGTKGPAPMGQGLLSRDGWHLIDDSKRPLIVRNWVSPRPDDAGLDWYLFGYGLDYKAALKALTAASGRVPMPRRYALGSWYSRWWPHAAEDYKRIVAEYKKHDFPLDILVLDMDWHKKDDWTGYSWNKELFPDPEGFLKWAHEQGLYVALNDHLEGSVKPFEDQYAAFMKDMDREPDGKTILPFDAGNKWQMLKLFQDVYAPLQKAGVDFWWLDYWSDDANRPFNHLRWINELYYEHSRQDNKRGLIFSRWGDWGNHRQPINFSGDTYILWSTLKFQVPFTANAGNVGAFYWAHDIGGYQGERNGELLARWTQFGAFSAALRLHSMNKPWLDKRPWSFPREIEDSMRVAYHLRSELLPYIYSTAWQAYDQSLPLLRPLYLEYPQDERAYKNPQEYLYGDAFLVAPIVTPGVGRKHVASQKVWLPEGAWYDWFSGRRFMGPLEKRFSADISSFPVFARGGVPIPMQPYAPRMTAAPPATLVVRAYPGEEGKTGTFMYYEDDGLTLAYSTGAFAYAKLEYIKEHGQVAVSITPGLVGYGGQLPRRDYVVELPGIGRAAKIAVDDKPTEGDYDAAINGFRVKVPERGSHDRVVVRIWTPKS